MSDGLTLAEEVLKGSQDPQGESEKWKRFGDMFNRDKALNMITDLRRKDIRRINSLEMLDKFLVEEWGVNLHLKEDTDREKDLLVSHERGGRKEGFSVLKQDIQIKKDPSKLEKILGV